MPDSEGSNESNSFGLYADESDDESLAHIHTSDRGEPTTQLADIPEEEPVQKYNKTGTASTLYAAFQQKLDDNESIESQEKVPDFDFSASNVYADSGIPPLQGSRAKYGKAGPSVVPNLNKLVSGDEVIKKARTLEKYREKPPSSFEIVAYFRDDQPLRAYFSKLIKGTGYKGSSFHQWIPLLSLVFALQIPVSDETYEEFVTDVDSSWQRFIDGGLSDEVLTRDEYDKFKGLADLRSPDDGPVLNRLMIAAKHAWRCTAYGITVPPLMFAVEAGSNVNYEHPMYTKFLSEGLSGSNLGKYTFPSGASIETIAATYCKTFGIR